EISARKARAVGVEGRGSGLPATGDLGKGHGVEAEFRAMARVRPGGEAEGKVLDARLRHVGLKGGHARRPFGFHVEPERPVELNLVAGDFHDAADERGAGGAFEFADAAGTAAVAGGRDGL